MLNFLAIVALIGLGILAFMFASAFLGRAVGSIIVGVRNLFRRASAPPPTH